MQDSQLSEQPSVENRLLNLAETSKIPLIKQIIGLAIDKIGAYNDLDNKEHVVALIDEVFSLYFLTILCRIIYKFFKQFIRKCVSTVVNAIWHVMIQAIKLLNLIH